MAPNPRQWPLHLKNPTHVDLQGFLALPVAHSRTIDFLLTTYQYLHRDFYRGLRTSRTIKTTSLSMDDVRIGVEKGKFELAVELNRITEHTYRGDASFGRLPEGTTA
ncbi:hypothetical protein ADEAN_000617400 [Angomonas deanei]|uniref:Uncharacterized protein n=1 Tax=Angomonas deanei TaxID=59799 RepID=A0A7G2CJ92_9TRYP|nr:hypothetical protein ADEAN_000617400 [Angomonas deanei]